MPLVILTASMSGTADFVAEELAAELARHGIANRIVPMQKAALAMFSQRKHFLVISSTYGTGDVPDNGQVFYRSLVEQRPDLRDVTYGIIGLGDMTYSATFCGGSARLDTILTELGAKRVAERLRHDRRSGVFPEKLALEWLADWIPLFRAEIARQA